MRSLISLTFDDGLRCHFESALPILNRYGLPATFFLVANTDPILRDGIKHPDWSKIDWREADIRLLKSVLQQGHEIGAHSVHHRQPFLDENPQLEAGGAKSWIESRLQTQISSYCYPFSHCTEAIKRAVIDAGYQQARWGANATYYSIEHPLDMFQLDSRHVSKANCEVIDGNYVGKYGSENVSGWLRPGYWHVLMYHGIGTMQDGWWPIPVSEFERQMAELARLRDSGAVEVVTFKQGAQIVGQTRLDVRPGVIKPGDARMNVTVIVCTYNRCEKLANALNRLAASQIPEPIEWEVLVVDNNSSDQTREVVDGFRLRDPAHFRYIFEPQQGLSHARNAGIAKARGEVLAFTDDDDEVEPDWMWNLTVALYSGPWAGVGGRIIPQWPKPVPKWLSSDRSTLDGPYGEFCPTPTAAPLTRPPYGGNVAYRREVFEKYGGYRVDLGRSGTNLQGREDIEFGNRLLAAGERLWFEPRAVTHAQILEERLEKMYALRWWYWYGRSEIADVGPPEAKWFIGGVPLHLFRKFVRWVLQWFLSFGASKRFSAQRTVWYLAGIAVGCRKWSRRRSPLAANPGANSETAIPQTDKQHISR